MGACGCGDTRPDFKFKVNDDLYLAFQIYPGCRECDTPAGMMIYRFDRKTAEDWCVPDLPDIPINQYSKNDLINGDCLIPILDVSSFTENMEALLSDEVWPIFRESVEASFDKWQSENRDNGYDVTKKEA